MKIEFADLLRHSESVGFVWNQAHDILTRDRVVPKDGAETIFEMANVEFKGYNPDTVKIVRTYMETRKTDRLEMRK